MFGEQNASEMETVLLGLDQEFRLKKIQIDEYETKKVISMSMLPGVPNKFS